MKLDFPEIKADFITDAKGNKKYIVLKVEQFEELMETLEDYYDMAQAAVDKDFLADASSLEEVEKRILGSFHDRFSLTHNALLSSNER